MQPLQKGLRKVLLVLGKTGNTFPRPPQNISRHDQKEQVGLQHRPGDPRCVSFMDKKFTDEKKDV